MRIGITGTRNGWTPEQARVFTDDVAELRVHEFHHGDCVGVDAQAASVIRTLHGDVLYIHPPQDDKLRAWTDGVKYQPKGYIERNHDIVNASDLMYVIPNQQGEVIRSGTWATYRYAMKQFKHVKVIYPCGRMEEYHP